MVCVFQSHFLVWNFVFSLQVFCPLVCFLSSWTNFLELFSFLWWHSTFLLWHIVRVLQSATTHKCWVKEKGCFTIFFRKRQWSWFFLGPGKLYLHVNSMAKLVLCITSFTFLSTNCFKHAMFLTMATYWMPYFFIFCSPSLTVCSWSSAMYW